jgi:uncharacterized protein (TIGR03435 family)
MAPFIESLLEDRFQLKAHRETRDLPVYELVIAKSGLKMKRSADPPPNSSFSGSLARRSLTGTAQPLGQLINFLAAELREPVIDKTGLMGLFDYALQWAADVNRGPVVTADRPLPTGTSSPTPEDVGGPTIFTALQEQLGLKLESTKGPVEVLVIDSVQRPTEN